MKYIPRNIIMHPDDVKRIKQKRMKLRIKELKKEFNTGKPVHEKVSNLYIGARLWPESSPKTQLVSVSNLLNNKRSSIDLEHLAILCEIFECTPNDLFGW